MHEIEVILSGWALFTGLGLIWARICNGEWDIVFGVIASTCTVLLAVTIWKWLVWAMG
jgi:hypothetical protein